MSFCWLGAFSMRLLSLGHYVIRILVLFCSHPLSVLSIFCLGSFSTRAFVAFCIHWLAVFNFCCLGALRCHSFCSLLQTSAVCCELLLSCVILHQSFCCLLQPFAECFEPLLLLGHYVIRVSVLFCSLLESLESSWPNRHHIFDYVWSFRLTVWNFHS